GQRLDIADVTGEGAAAGKLGFESGEALRAARQHGDPVAAGCEAPRQRASGPGSDAGEQTHVVVDPPGGGETRGPSRMKARPGRRRYRVRRRRMRAPFGGAGRPDGGPRPSRTARIASVQRRSTDALEVPSHPAISVAARPCVMETRTCAMSVASPSS